MRESKDLVSADSNLHESSRLLAQHEASERTSKQERVKGGEREIEIEKKKWDGGERESKMQKEAQREKEREGE